MIQVKFNMEPGCDDLKPAKAHADDAAFDLRSRVDMTAQPGKVALVPTGLHLELPVGYEAQVRPRSGLALKHQIGVLNSPGTIDAGYRGEVCCILFNFGDAPFEIKRGAGVRILIGNDLEYSLLLIGASEVAKCDKVGLVKEEYTLSA